MIKTIKEYYSRSGSFSISEVSLFQSLYEYVYLLSNLESIPFDNIKSNVILQVLKKIY